MTKIHPMVQALLDEVDDFRERTGMTPSEFGLGAVNDGNVLRALRMGRVPSLASIDRLRKFMETYGKTKASRKRTKVA